MKQFVSPGVSESLNTADISDIFPFSFAQLFIKAIKHNVLFLFHCALEPVQPILTFSFYIQCVRNSFTISNDKIQIQNQWAQAETVGAHLKGEPYFTNWTPGPHLEDYMSSNVSLP